eukprot:m.101392 g.101392  ORF g.101392 m.101392 type:complete len:843 (+) comp14089_c0_seq4:55-2583(+)
MAMGEHDFNLPGYTPAPRFSGVSQAPRQAFGDEDEDDEPAIRFQPQNATKRRSESATSEHRSEHQPKEVTTYQTLLASLPSQQPGAGTAGAIAMQTFGVITPELLEEVARASDEASPGKGLMRTLTRGKISREHSRHTLARGKSVVYRTLNALASPDDLEARQDIDESKKIIALTKAAPAPMTKKIDIIKTEHEAMKSAQNRLSGFQLFMASTAMSWTHLKRWVRDMFQYVLLWEKDIKMLAGRHGAVAGQFFRFLRWSLVLNILIAFIWICFVIIPFVTTVQPLSTPASLRPAIEGGYSSQEKFVGLFTGGGPLNYSAYFIGTYFVPYKSVASAGASTLEFDSNYDVALAYLLTLSFFLLFTFVLIFRKVYMSVYNESLASGEPVHALAEIVFCSFDHSLTQEDSVRLKRIGLVSMIKETLSESLSKQEYKEKNKRTLYFKRTMVNFVVCSILAVSLFGVKSSVDSFSSNLDSYTRLIPSAILAALNVILPVLFELLGKLEEWRTELFLIQITVLRSMVMRITSLFIFFYTVFLQRSRYMCWESFVGQYVYSVFIIVFVVEMLVCLGVDPMKRFMAARFPWIERTFGAPRFDAVNNTIELIYSQTIILFGTFFCPLLPALGVLRCIISFYIHRFNTLHACQPPLTAFKARYSFTELFFVVMLVMLFLVAFPLGYAITRLPTSGAYMSDSTNQFFMSVPTTSSIACNTTTPSCAVCLNSFNASASVCWMPNDAVGVLVSMSQLCQACPSGCGPFRNQESIYATALKEFDTWSPDAQASLRFIGTASFAAIVILILLMGWFYLHAKVRASTSLVERLRMERDSERTDKMWILEKYAIILDDHR